MPEAAPSGVPDLTGVGGRLGELRRRNHLTLAELSATTGIALSTLSRLESGRRHPTSPQLVTLAAAYQVPVDELLRPAATQDPRVRPRHITRDGMTLMPLTRRPGGVQAYKIIVPAPAARISAEPEKRSHEGYEWIYVLSGRLRLLLGEHDLTMTVGEAAEFDTRVPHWFGSAGPGPAEVLALFGPQGERIHVRARPTST